MGERLDKLRALSPEQLEAKIREAEPIWREADRQASGLLTLLMAAEDAEDPEVFLREHATVPQQDGQDAVPPAAPPLAPSVPIPALPAAPVIGIIKKSPWYEHPLPKAALVLLGISLSAGLGGLVYQNLLETPKQVAVSNFKCTGLKCSFSLSKSVPFRLLSLAGREQGASDSLVLGTFVVPEKSVGKPIVSDAVFLGSFEMLAKWQQKPGLVAFDATAKAPVGEPIRSGFVTQARPGIFQIELHDPLDNPADGVFNVFGLRDGNWDLKGQILLSGAAGEDSSVQALGLYMCEGLTSVPATQEGHAYVAVAAAKRVTDLYPVKWEEHLMTCADKFAPASNPDVTRTAYRARAGKLHERQSAFHITFIDTGTFLVAKATGPSGAFGVTVENRGGQSFLITGINVVTASRCPAQGATSGCTPESDLQLEPIGRSLPVAVPPYGSVTFNASFRANSHPGFHESTFQFEHTAAETLPYPNSSRIFDRVTVKGSVN